ncbi:MAG: FecR domain-containing protein [Potamolinea sp.]
MLTEGMGLFIGEQLRTVGEALAEIELKNGLAFRIGGNSVLTLQPDNSLNLSKGEMITWVQPGKQVPAKVVTPGAIAGIRGTTIYVNIPDDPNGEIEYFTWEGTMSLKLPNQSEEMLLKAGEIVKVKPGETDINQMRKRVRQLTQKEWETRRKKSRLINNFISPLPTLKKIDQVAPKETKKSTLAPKQLKLSAPQKVNNNTASPTPKTPANSQVEVSLTPTPKQQPTPQVEVSLAPTTKQQATPQEQPVTRQILLTPYPKFQNPSPTLKTTPQANPKETASSPNYRQVEKKKDDENDKDF